LAAKKRNYVHAAIFLRIKQNWRQKAFSFSTGCQPPGKLWRKIIYGIFYNPLFHTFLSPLVTQLLTNILTNIFKTRNKILLCKFIL